MRFRSISDLFKGFVGLATPPVCAKRFSVVIDSFYAVQRPALVLVLHDTKGAAVAATIERLGFLDGRPATNGTR